MKVSLKLVHKDGSELDFEVEGNDALFQSAIITRNGRYYVYQSMGGFEFARSRITFQEVDQPYAVNF